MGQSRGRKPLLYPQKQIYNVLSVGTLNSPHICKSHLSLNKSGCHPQFPKSHLSLKVSNLTCPKNGEPPLSSDKKTCQSLKQVASFVSK
jgi:hypothetical protein